MQHDLEAVRHVDGSHVVVFSGAGLSAESGIPTFRDATADALWSRFDPMELASEAGFRRQPEVVRAWYHWRRTKVCESEPNPAHIALAASGYPQVTQNVDDLLERAGADPQKVHHLHGTILHDHCMDGCGCSVPFGGQKTQAPGICPECGAFLRPSVVWFGESLPMETWQRACQLCEQATCLIVVGTSGLVFPASELIEICIASGGTVLNVNPHESNVDARADVNLRAAASEMIPRVLKLLSTP